MSELSPQEIEYQALYELEYEQQAINTNSTASFNHNIDKAELIKFLLMLFAYGWWSVIVVYYGLLNQSVSLHYQIMSLPIVVVALCLARVFQLAINQESYGFAALFFSGLLVAGMLS